MPRDTQPPTPDELFARVILTREELDNLTPELQTMLDADLDNQLFEYKVLGWKFDDADVISGVTNTDGHQIVVWKSVKAWPYGSQP